MNAPREPTADELDAIVAATAAAQGFDCTQMEWEEHEQMTRSAHIAVFDNFVSDGPGYCGRVAVIVWPGGPEIISSVTLDAHVIAVAGSSQ